MEVIFLVSVWVNVFNLFVFAFLVVVNALEENDHAIATGHPAEISSYVIFIFLKCLHHRLSFRLFILRNKVHVTVFAWQLFFFMLHGL